MPRVLLLHRTFEDTQSTATAYFSSFIQQENIAVDAQYAPISLIQRIVNKILGGFYCYKYGKWKHSLNEYTVIIVHVQKNSYKLLEYICSKRLSNQRVIAWYWNPVCQCLHPDKIRNLGCELWSFDSADCQKYDLNFNTTYYFRGLKLPSKPMECVNVFFCGLNKGRKKVLDDIRMKFEQMALTYYFHVIDEKAPISQQLPRLSYQEYLEHLASSDAILDVLQEGQEGMTLRVMEALFHQKKLITTQKAIMKADFYHPDNIFVIGEDNWAEIKNFLECPLHPVPKEIVEKYDFSMWIRRFGIDLEKR